MFTLWVLPAFYSLGKGILAPGVQWLVCEFDRSPVFHMKVNNE